LCKGDFGQEKTAPQEERCGFYLLLSKASGIANSHFAIVAFEAEPIIELETSFLSEIQAGVGTGG